MKFQSKYFTDACEAVGVAEALIDDDYLPKMDRQNVANFYNGRETMTEDEAEAENVGSTVNHLFGYSALDRLRSQISSIVTANKEVFKVECTDPNLDVGQRDYVSAIITKELNKRIRKSRRFSPEWRATAGNLILHGRNVLSYRDKTDWCPVSSFLYVPQRTKPSRDDVSYAFSPEEISLGDLTTYEKAARKDGHWNHRAIKDALEALKPGDVTAPIIDRDLDDATVAENINQDTEFIDDAQTNTRVTLPVWYVYEVDHSKPERPVSLKIIARYQTLSSRSQSGYKMKEHYTDADIVLYQRADYFKNNTQWIFPFFIDTEIGGRPTWHSVVGLGKLNYPRDTDTEEFFNTAMAGAKDRMRIKWKVGEAASRQKLQRFLAENSDILPEGIDPVEMRGDPSYQHAFQIIGMLQQLSASDAGSPVMNQGQSSDELEIQAAERQSAAASVIANRMNDIYEGLDDLGAEIVRRFLAAPASPNDKGYADIETFRMCLESQGFSREFMKNLASTEHGCLKYLEVTTIRAIGDGSRMAEAQGIGQLMASLGVFGPKAQELIKRRYAQIVTRDPYWAAELVPIEDKPDPDQLTRARTENNTALTRGVLGVVPQVNDDDVSGIHMPEHDSAIDAELERGNAAGGIDQTTFAGIQSLAQHQMQHIQMQQGHPTTAEIANVFEQKITKQMTTAEGLHKAFLENQNNEEMSQLDRIKVQQKQQEIDLKTRSQLSIEQDREEKNTLAKRQTATNEAIATTQAAAKAAEVQAKINQPQAQ